MSRLYHFTIPIIALSIFIRLEYSEFFRPTEITNTSGSQYGWTQGLIDSVGIPDSAFNLALYGFSHLKRANQLRNDSLLTIIDYSKPSVEKRFFILDIRNGKVVRTTLVAHGKNSGELNAESFSNAINSNKSSLGFFVTQNAYQGKHGYSLRIQGMNNGLNDNVLKRAVVIHGAEYVSDTFIQKSGRIGRSFGCPALPVEEVEEVIDLIKNGSFLFIYHPTLFAKSPSVQGILL